MRSEKEIEVRLLMPADAGLRDLWQMANSVGCGVRVEQFGQNGIFRFRLYKLEAVTSGGSE